MTDSKKGVELSSVAAAGQALALPADVQACHALIQAQAAMLIELQAQVALLQERISLDSNNSSKPPSFDGPGRPNRAQRRASTKKRGAQPGHKDYGRSMVEEGQVDWIHDCRPQSVCECGAAIVADDQAPQRHQVFDVPPMKAVIDEYRLHGGRCAGCGKRHIGSLPVGVPRGPHLPASIARSAAGPCNHTFRPLGIVRVQPA